MFLSILVMYLSVAPRGFIDSQVSAAAMKGNILVPPLISVRIVSSTYRQTSTAFLLAVWPVDRLTVTTPVTIGDSTADVPDVLPFVEVEHWSAPFI